MQRTPQTYTKSNPFIAKVTERYSLSSPHSVKNTQHIVLDLNGSNIEYHVGDCIAICPDNDPDLVQRTLAALNCTGNEMVSDAQKTGEWPLREFFTKKANITEFSRKLVMEIAARHPHAEKKDQLNHLLEKGTRENFKQYVAQRELWKLLQEHPEVQFAPQELCHLLMPLLPRFYSIASSQKMVGNEVHLTVALVKYESDGTLRHGVATNYLVHIAPMHEAAVPMYVQPHHGFTLPEDNHAPIIMIGPGTGVAPFRAFIQERLARSAPGKNWLFFGECNRAHDFFYEGFWQEAAKQGKLILTTAFSRDQAHKVYVQHRLLEHAKGVFEWLQNGAYLYLCGDAERMAKDVEATLHHIVMQQGNRDEQGAKAYIKELRQQKRFLKDVY